MKKQLAILLMICLIPVTLITAGATTDASYAKTGKQSVKIVTWADGTDKEIAAMVKAADEGKINLQDYWNVGDERTVTLSAMAGAGLEAHEEQTVTLVLMNAGGKLLADPVKDTSGALRYQCSFVVGLKNGLAEQGKINGTASNAGAWKNSLRRTWCNRVFRDALPENLRSIFKKFRVKTAASSAEGSEVEITEDYFTLPADGEVFEDGTFSVETEREALHQFTWYETQANRIKRAGDGGLITYFWTRSPGQGDRRRYCMANAKGNGEIAAASDDNLISPYGCI